MSWRILNGAAAVLVEDEGKKILVIADLHLTDEDDIVQELIKKVKGLIKTQKPDILLVNGDMFHFGTGGRSVELFDKALSKIIDLRFIMGNHDPDVFLPAQTTKNYCFCHGDYDYKLPQKRLVLAHTHPFLDGKRVFLKGKLVDGREFLVLPPFNPRVGGPDIKEKHLLLGFIFRKQLIKECLVYNLDGKKIAKLN